MVIKTALVKKITTRLISRQKVAKNIYNKPTKRMTIY